MRKCSNHRVNQKIKLKFVELFIFYIKLYEKRTNLRTHIL